MDFIDNLIFTATNAVGPGAVLRSNYSNPIFTLAPTPTGAPPSYSNPEREIFCSYEDQEVLENAIQKHWFDIVNQRAYGAFIDFDVLSGSGVPYHMIYAYLTENTRIFQIYEKLLFMFQHDEELNKIDDPSVFQWLQNTEALFFKSQASYSQNGLSSSVRLDPEASRRNAYYRMFGMELAFGNSKDNGTYPYVKAKFANNAFVPLFERFLVDFWQAFINRNNTSGANTTDLENLTDTAEKLQEMLFSRRTTNINFQNYRYYNLSREEFAAVGLMSWLFDSISYNSKLVTFLNCTGNSPGERLTRLGQKVGVPAHSKSKNLLDLAAPTAQFLRDIEKGTYRSTTYIASVLAGVGSFRLIQDNLILIINNWEKATNHRIKNPESNIIGTVKVANGSAAWN